MNGWLHTLKPAAPVRWHLWLAAAMWTVVGALLLSFGSRWVIQADLAGKAVWLALVLAAGVVKARLVLNRAAGRIADRIRARGDGRCIGGFLSVKSYLLVGLMAGGGRLLRGRVLPQEIVGLVYVGVGAALVVGALTLWRAWLQETTGHPKGTS